MIDKNTYSGQVKPRYMVDMVTYQELYPSKDVELNREYLSDGIMEAKMPPDEDFLLHLPATVHGFGFQDKKWRKYLLYLG